MKIHHLNCGWLTPEAYPPVPCHCLLLEAEGGVALVDTGIGLQDVKNPDERIGQELIRLAGFTFAEENTAVRQLERAGMKASDVTDIILTHADPDHAGGLADFPSARAHLAGEELANLRSGNWRYRQPQFAHGPLWRSYGSQAVRDWFGFPARPVELSFESEVLLVPLFGHTKGHCGVAIRQGNKWVLHVGDAYYLRAELATDPHPVSALAALRADDDGLRRRSLAGLRRLAADHGAQVEYFGYHDRSELPAEMAGIGGEGERGYARMLQERKELSVSHTEIEPDAVVRNERVFAVPPGKIFAAFEQPEQLATWWGPKDFTNTFEQFEFTPGGRWVFVMHGPNGVGYPNECVFREIVPDARIVIEHVVNPWFRLTVTLTARGDDRTHLAWDQEFESPEVAAKLRPLCETANEQNLDRLQALLAGRSS